MIPKNYQWYVIKTKSRHEFAVEIHFNKVGIECFCPSMKEVRLRKSGIATVTVPLFSLYVFVRASNKEYVDVLHHESVKDFIRCAGIPEIIKDEQIEGLKLLTKQVDNFEITGISFRKGEQIIVQSGPFAGMKGEIVSVRGKKRVLVRISCIEYGILLKAVNLISAIQPAI